MKIDKDSFKQPQTWAVIVPVVLFLWVLMSLLAMNKAHRAYEKQARETKEVQTHARDILAIMEEIGAANLPDAMSGEFDPISSVRACAEAAFIR